MMGIHSLPQTCLFSLAVVMVVPMMKVNSTEQMFNPQPHQTTSPECQQSATMSKPSSFMSSLHQTLLSLHDNPYPTIANPSNCPRRASVALILRIRPPYSGFPAPTDEAAISADSTQTSPLTFAERLDSFFSLPWVQSGTPEVLFIKRAARRGDRWTSQIAFPGGKRDPADISDEATAERETLEEVGLDISSSSAALLAGPLPQRIVTTDFGARPLMVLCPFVFLLMDADIGHLKLQPAEVASAHWIPVAALLDPAARTYEQADVVDRMASRWGKITRTFLQWNLGQVLYAAIRLRPSESLFSIEDQALPEPTHQADGGLLSHVLGVVGEDIHSGLTKWGLIGADPDPSRRLLLWGITHGITCDFLGLLPAAKGLEWWRWPTLSRSDVRFMIWLVSYRFRKMKTQASKAGRMEDRGTPVLIGEGLGVRSSEETTSMVDQKTNPTPATIYSSAGFLLDGYFEQIQRAAYIALATRLLLGTATAWYFWKRYSRTR